VLGAGLRSLPSTPAQLLARRAVRGSVTEPSLVRVDRLATGEHGDELWIRRARVPGPLALSIR